MGKKSGTLKSSIEALEKARGASHAETIADYGVASSAVAAGTAGLSKQMSRIQAVTQGVDRRTVRGVAKLSDKARQLQRRTIAEQNRISQNYGGAFGGSAALEFYGARARAGAGARSAEANVRLGVDQAKAGQLAMGIAKQGVAAGSAAASYALAQAMQSRFMVTNDTIAGLEANLQATALQYNLQLRNAKALQEDAENKAGTENKAGVKGIIAEGSDIATSIGSFAQTYASKRAGDPTVPPLSQVPVTQLVEAWSAQTGFTDDTHKYLATIAFRKMQQGMNAGPAFQEAIKQSYGDMKGFATWGAPALKSIASSAGARELATATAAEAAEASDDAFNQGWNTGMNPFADISSFQNDVGYATEGPGRYVQGVGYVKPGEPAAEPTGTGGTRRAISFGG
jgi:hypothetical protein